MRGARTIRKLLVANRGEIAVRAFRAAYELGIETVAVYPWEDRNSMHRQKASEAYEIGERGHPVHAYLDVGELVRVALDSGADAVYPGYGFLAENPALAEACATAGITFVGPGAGILRLTGNKVEALAAAERAGIAVLRRSGALASPGDAAQTAGAVGFPLFVKAAAGGGGRGMRRVEEPGELAAAVEAAMREAASAFGDATVFLEEAMTAPRHIEVQLLGDAAGGVVHLYERDCSIQRRHQKLVELAPAPNLDPAIRHALCVDAVRFGRAIGYENAGTVEFLLDGSGRHVFIEMNPRIQVEHTVTEETTDVDLVQTQLRIAGGATLAELGLTQDRIRQHGAALQCRITTEDPANDFRPDTGRISVYRSPGGAGIRLDGGTTYAGAEIPGYFDSLLVKLTCRGADLEVAVARARRALAEFRIRGVATNLPFLQAVLHEPDFVGGNLSTSFVDERPHLLRPRAGGDRATRLVTLLAGRTVNRPHGHAPTRLDPRSKLPELAPGPASRGSRDRLLELGAARFAQELRAQQALAVTDTTLRDAHQSLLATRMRTFDILAVAPHLGRMLPGLLSLEAWGGATYDVALRFLHEDPWERLARLREAVPGTCLQMLLRGRNTVGYTPYPDAVCRAFVAEAAQTGVDVFRIFDALNDTGQMRVAIEAAVEAGALVEGCLCYTGDLADPAEDLYTLDYYLRLAEELAAAGAHVLCIKDMAGLLRPPAAHTLVSALRERFDQPVHLHTHDTAGGQLATYLAAAQAGVDAVDAAAPPLSGMTSQPSLAALVAATDHTPRATGIPLEAVNAFEPYWHAVRRLYAPFEMGLSAPTGTVYRHEIPGGQLSNLRAQAAALGLGDRFEEVEELYAEADRLLGRLVKVTPSSKVVGDLALQLAGSGISPAELAEHPEQVDLPASVIGFLAGELGTPPGGWPEPFRTRALAGRQTTAPAAELAPDQAEALAGPSRRAVLNELLFPGPTQEQRDAAERHGDVNVLPTRLFLYGLEPGEEETVDLEPGVRLILELEAVGEPDERGIRTVLVRVNGQLRPFDVRDERIAVELPHAERANPGDPGHVAAPYNGAVTVLVAVGDAIEAGTPVATIEAMKMESMLASPVEGVVERVAIPGVATVQAGDLVLVVRPAVAG
ncbi:MAG: pyruvate carboxylase [Gaiellales bacterium]